MAAPRAELGHDYVALTDHSPRLTVAHGLTAERLREQLGRRRRARRGARRRSACSPGIEVDILDDGRLDQEHELLAELDVVVASVHSKLRDAADAMTRRMLAAVADPHTDVLGHCTGRWSGGSGTRPESQFDAELVFAACAELGMAVEMNSRPERLDPPLRLLRLAVEMGCMFAIDTDAHAPGQLDWQPLRLRARRRVRRPARARRQHLAAGRPARVDGGPRPPAGGVQRRLSRSGRPPRGRRVTRASTRGAGAPAGRSTRRPRSSSASTRTAWTQRDVRPMQSRGPAPKGTYSPRGAPCPEARKRSGSNRSGSPHDAARRCSSQGLTITRVPAGTSTPSTTSAASARRVITQAGG